jgi:hypothetical protein
MKPGRTPGRKWPERKTHCEDALGARRVTHDDDEDAALRSWVDQNLVLVFLLTPLLVVLAVFQVIAGLLTGEDR